MLQPSPATHTPVPKQQESALGKVVGGFECLVLIILVIVAFVSCVSMDRSGPRSYTAQAQAICQEMVTERLRAPSTAKFGGWDINETMSAITIQGHVDAQNGFGATMRNEFQCTVTLDSAGEPDIIRVDYLR